MRREVPDEVERAFKAGHLAGLQAANMAELRKVHADRDWQTYRAALRPPADAERDAMREALECAADDFRKITSQNPLPSNSEDKTHEHYLRTVLIALAKDAETRARAALLTPQAAGKTDAGRMREDPTKMGGGIPVHILARGNWHPGDDA